MRVFRPALALAAVLAVLPLTGCATAAGGDDLDTLATWMTGTFSSAAQAAGDPEAYRPVRLVMLPIWQERSDGPWLYVEQAVVGAEERPYRQRVYHLSVPVDGFGLRSDVYELPAPERFVAAWDRPGAFEGVEPDDLELRDGCAIRLRRRADGAFAGETEGTGCRSRLGGAAYATSEVVVTADRLASWDRGFDAAHQQVWGAEKGPYVFDRLGSGPPAAD